MNRKALRVTKLVARRLVAEGAKAVVVFGSWVRGDAYRESDIDIHAIGRGSRYRLEREQDFLVSVSWRTSGQHRKTFKDPSEVGGIIPAWRNSKIIYDPQEIAYALKREAQKWQWKPLSKQADRWVAEEITGWAEEVHRLIGNMQLGRRTAAAVQRSVLAIKMAPIIAVYYRILYDSENRLWDLVAEKKGKNWTRLQNRALGKGDQNFQDTCKAALELYATVAQEVKHLLSPSQHQVVAHACQIAGHPLSA